jgi:predicted PurR-regulated permease PerM
VTPLDSKSERREERPRLIPDWPLLIFTLLLGFLAFETFRPLWLPLVLAAWLALIAKPIHRRLSRAMRGQHRGAGPITVVMVLAVLAPFAILILSFFSDVVALFRSILERTATGDLWELLGAPEEANTTSPTSWIELAERHGASAFRVATGVAGATAALVIGLLVFVMTFYVLLIDGGGVYRWFARYAPLRRQHTRRLTLAFNESGRGLIIGVGLTALIQGAVAGLGYWIVGAPYPFALGMLTAFASVVPVVGTALVWVPVAVLLGATGRLGAASAMLGIGFLVATIDNFVRPILSRYGKLNLPTFAVFVAMLGGIAAFGPWGVLLGPLYLRLAVEGLRLYREERRLHERL